MKKRLYILIAVDIAAKLALIGVFFFLMYIACLAVDGSIRALVGFAAVGGALAAGKWLYNFLPEVEALISKMKRVIKRAESTRT